MHLYFCVDESGSFNTSYEQYYIISGIVVRDNYLLQERHKKIEKEIRNKQNQNKELKASRIRDEQKAKFINSMLECDDIHVVSLVIDKKKLNQKYNFVVSEFLIYNYAMKELLVAAMENNMINENDEILCFVDSRTMNYKVHNDLESYLNLEFFDYLKRITVIYKDSSITREVQMADYVSNTVYGYFNKTNKAYQYVNRPAKIIFKQLP